jgi:hypothetical protein
MIKSSKLLRLVICIFVLGGVPSRAGSFRENWKRYPRPDELINVLKDTFPLALSTSGLVPMTCYLLSEENRSLLGDNKPSEGSPVVSQPNFSFVNWYSSCLATYISAEFGKREATTDESGVLGVKPWVNADALTKNDEARAMWYSAWKNLTTVQKLSLISGVVEKMIGPAELIETSDSPNLVRDTLDAMEEFMINGSARDGLPLAIRPLLIDSANTGTMLKLAIYIVGMHVDQFLKY